MAAAQGWLDPATPLPDDAVLAEVLKPSRTNRSAASCVAPYHSVVKRWAEQGIQCRMIHQALMRHRGFTSSYSSVYRYVQSLVETAPRGTCHLALSRSRTRPRSASSAT